MLLTNLMFTSITERSRKPDRYQPIFFSFFRTRTIRSKSLENLFDRQTPLSQQQQQQHQQRKEGKLNKRIVLQWIKPPSHFDISSSISNHVNHFILLFKVMNILIQLK